MISRLIIWILLALVPFQSFASVGVFECPARTNNAVEMRHARVNKLDQHVSEADSGMHLHAHRDHSVQTPVDAHASTDSGHHHSHKLPCCSDGAIIFSPNVPLSLKSERFVTTGNIESVGLSSIFLEGPKRPPRLTLS